jgi:hypothetical protein
MVDLVLVVHTVVDVVLVVQKIDMVLVVQPPGVQATGFVIFVTELLELGLTVHAERPEVVVETALASISPVLKPLVVF